MLEENLLAQYAGQACFKRQSWEHIGLQLWAMLQGPRSFRGGEESKRDPYTLL